jgi:crotonobetainyl-CoA:carnitine CoA-transferase CaiB-like acyl-CoA transferase
MLVEAEHPLAGPIRLLRNPLRMSETPVTDYPAPPLLGEHTRDVLARAAGLTAAVSTSCRGPRHLIEGRR